ncbi:MAG TPA: hypothetical protein HA257_07945 [Candidatus Methanoperedenaceae archaeon]|nr:hypothetical protein [Candidatus Methanoperedenaceae archaeon]
MDESYLLIQDVAINVCPGFDNSVIKQCSACGDLIPEKRGTILESCFYCQVCRGTAYYTVSRNDAGSGPSPAD